MAYPHPVVVMGVSGSGKTTVGELLAEALGLPFLDGDSLHPAANVAKMESGVPLTDDDRRPWLDAVGARLAEGPVVIACSALKRSYRDRLRAAAPDLRLVYLRGDRKLLERRLKKRKGHFMPSSLLDSQLATLERPDGDEQPIVLEISRAPKELVHAAVLRLEAL